MHSMLAYNVRCVCTARNARMRHFSLIRHNHNVARVSVLWRDINLLINWDVRSCWISSPHLPPTRSVDKCCARWPERWRCIHKFVMLSSRTSTESESMFFSQHRPKLTAYKILRTVTTIIFLLLLLTICLLCLSFICHTLGGERHKAKAGKTKKDLDWHHKTRRTRNWPVLGWHTRALC